MGLAQVWKLTPEPQARTVATVSLSEKVTTLALGGAERVARWPAPLLSMTQEAM